MSQNTVSAEEQKRNRINVIRTALGIGGIVAVILGAVLLIAPEKTAVFLAAMIAIYVIIAGIIYAGIGIFSRRFGFWARVGHIVLGVLFFLAGALALSELQNTTVVLATIVAIIIGVVWIFEGFVSLLTLRESRSTGVTVFFAIISIIAGIFLITSPMYAIAILWLFLGISLVILGIMQVVRAFSLGKESTATTPSQ